MKKLLMKLFPDYFNVTKLFDLDQIEVLGHPYRLAIIDTETNKTFEALGIPEDRLKFLFGKLNSAMENCNCKLQVLNKLEPHIRHINEFYACQLMLEHTASNQSGIGGLIGMFMDDMLKRRGGKH